jgi:16S rRNA (guanine(966)-N(2))-methyltransferase RsmD
MRIISGKYRGLKLTAPAGNDIRPTTDRIKEDIFNILGAETPDSDFLDLFAGTGAIGIEALSRGAESVTLIDMSGDAVALIHQNTAKLKGEQPARIIRTDARKFLIETKNKYDIIFLDPPYQFSGVPELIEIIVARNLLKADGVLVVEQGIKTTMPDFSRHLLLYKIKKYASTVLYFFSAVQEGDIKA